MNWDDLRTLAAAGRALAVDPTTVGRRVLAIEAELGSRLFERTADGHLATHTGQIAIAHGETMERTAFSLSHQLEGSDARVAGPVRLTALDSMFDAMIIPKLPRLLARHPGLELTFCSGLALMDLSRREADIAIRSNKPKEPDAVGRKLGRLAVAFYAALGFGIGDRPPLIGLPGDRETTGFATFLPKFFPHSPMVARGNTEGHMLALVRAGIGVGLLDCFVGDASSALRRALPEPVMFHEMWAVVHVEMHKSPRVRAVMDFLTEIFAEDADLIAGNQPRHKFAPADDGIA